MGKEFWEPPSVTEDNKKRRVEAKIQANKVEAREFARDRVDQLRKELKDDIGRLDFRMATVERLIWNRLFVFGAGFLASGILISLLYLGLR